VNRNTRLFLGTERSSTPGKRDLPQALFLRAISNSEGTTSAAGAERVLLMAMDELERAMLDARVSDTASIRVFLNVLPDVTMKAEECAENFKLVMDRLISKYATRLLKLRVDEIEIKLRVNDSQK
jgi:acetyl-CoA carboxylase/biotin carboxylase 1